MKSKLTREDLMTIAVHALDPATVSNAMEVALYNFKMTPSATNYIVMTNLMVRFQELTND